MNENELRDIVKNTVARFRAKKEVTLENARLLSAAVKDAFGGYLADFAFQRTGSPIARANVYKFIRNGGERYRRDL